MSSAGTSTSRRERRLWQAALVAATAFAACLVLVGVAAPQRTPATSFDWVHPASAPVGWKLAPTPSGASVAYPPAWHTITSDPGTVTAAPPGPRPELRGYLKATPPGAGATLANWARVRVRHAHNVRLEAAANDLRFQGGATGSCVIDSFSRRGARLREIACIVDGHATTVVVAAAPAAGWARRAPVLERAVTSFVT